MSKFSTYSMAGIGIAAAIGFVFALSFLSNNAETENGTDFMPPSTEPSSFLLQQRTDSATTLLDGNQEAAEQMAPDASEGEGASMMMRTQETFLRPMLNSVTAADGTTGETIGKVMQGMQFTSAKPVFIRAELFNPNDVQVSNTIALGISKGNTSQESGNSTEMLTQRQPYEEATSFHGTIGARESVVLELYWIPSETGQYTLLLFSIAPENLTSNEPIDPIASIPIKVVNTTSS